MAELHYFGAQGRGQQIRYTLAEGGVEWTDVSAAFPASEDDKAKWLALGGNLTTNVPMLVMGGKAYTQSSAVLRHAARKGGLMPADEELQYQVDNIILAVDDFRTAAYKVIFPALKFTPDAEANALLKETNIPKHFKNFERLLGGPLACTPQHLALRTRCARSALILRHSISRAQHPTTAAPHHARPRGSTEGAPHSIAQLSIAPMQHSIASSRGCRGQRLLCG